MSAKVLGIGGIFFRSTDPESIGAWYQKWLGLPVEAPYGAMLKADNMPKDAYSVWAPFKDDTSYFGDREQSFMINFMVDNVEHALAQVKEGGAEIAGEIEKFEYGIFGWFIDPDGNKVELWQPLNNA